MENASKALLIAGSVLIVILLIAFGMKIFNSSSGTADNVGDVMKTTEMATFNSKFTAYVGNNESKAEVVSLLNTVISNNAVTDQKVDIYYFKDGRYTLYAPNALLNILEDRAYIISIGDSSGGYINRVNIK